MSGGPSAVTPPPACPVRGCDHALARDGRCFACPRGHSFDVAREGYLNLLQPADSRARRPGDAAAVVAARRRLLDAGVGAALARAVGELVAAHAAPEVPPDAPAAALSVPLSVLDVGCGEGWLLRELSARRPIDACGIDLSTAAAAAAARARPDALFVVANADRGLPWPDAAFDVALTVTARRPVAEIARVLRRTGLLVVAVAAPDDLVELRRAVLGRGDATDRLPGLRAELAPAFEEIEHRQARAGLYLSAELLRDALAATYRGARASQHAKAAALAAGAVTVAHDVLALRPRA